METTEYLKDKHKKMQLENYLIGEFKTGFNDSALNTIGWKVVGVDINTVYGDMPKTSIELTIHSKLTSIEQPLHSKLIGADAHFDSFCTKREMLDMDLNVIEQQSGSGSSDITLFLEGALQKFKSEKAC